MSDDTHATDNPTPKRRGRPRSVPRRAARGQGSIQKRRKRNGSGFHWVAQFNGQQKYAATEALAVEELDKLKAAYRAGATAPVSPTTTVAEYLDSWLADRTASGSIAASTALDYQNMLRYYLKPHLGEIRLSRLAPADVRRMLTALRDGGKSSRTQSKARKILARALKTAQQDGLIATNAAALTDGPKIDDAYEGRTMTPEQARTVLAAANDTPTIAAYVALGLLLGLRPGESLALTWDQVDFTADTVRITSTLMREPGGRNADGTPRLVRISAKTKQSRATVPLPPPAREALLSQRERQEQWRQAAGDAWVTSDHVITTEVGTPLDPAVARHRFQRLTRTVIGEAWNPHQMRHSCALLLTASWSRSTSRRTLSFS